MIGGLAEKAAPRNGRLRLSYIIGTYPVLTETFIDREIRHLLDAGVDLEIVSIRRPRTDLSPFQRELSKRVTYLLPVVWPGLLWAQLSAALGRPRTYFGTLAWLLTRRHDGAPRRRTAYHFVTGVYVARVLRHRRGIHLHAHFVDRAATVALVASRFLDSTYSVTAHAREIYVDAFLLRERIGEAVFAATCTEYNRRYLVDLVGPEVAPRVLRLYHGLDLQTYLDGPERSPSADRPLLLAVAQLAERKGLHHLIDACRILVDRGRSFTCEIVGDGPLRGELERQVRDLGLSGTVHLTGPLPYPEVVARYPRAAAFVLPCIVTAEGDRDGIPNVILEAMAAAVPVVSTPVSGIPEVLRDGDTGLVVPEGDASAIADAVERLLDDPALGVRLGTAARAFVSDEFDLTRNINRLVERFEALAPPMADPMTEARPPALADAMFLVWAERHRGTRSSWLAESLGITDLRYLSPTRRRGMRAAWQKYPAQLAASAWALITRRPRVIFVQSPPSFAAWTAALYGAATGSAVVIDAHSDAFERSIWTRPAWVTRLVARQATATLVTNGHWARRLGAWGATALNVPSIPTTFVAGDPPALAPGPNIAVVNTWAFDEPLNAVLDAASLVPEVTFHVSGRDDRLASLGRSIPDNVRFTGFLEEDAYHGLLRAADAVMCLTTRDHTMQNGACEALSHATPIVTSDWPVLREYFSAGTAHVDNSAEDIARGVRQILADPDRQRREIAALRERRSEEWHETRASLLARINDRLDGRQHRSRRRPGREEHG